MKLLKKKVSSNVLFHGTDGPVLELILYSNLLHDELLPLIPAHKFLALWLDTQAFTAHCLILGTSA